MSNRRLTANDMPEKVASGEMTLDEYITTMQRKKKLINRLIEQSLDWDESRREEMRETPLPIIEKMAMGEPGISVSEAGEDVPTSNVESAEPDDFTTGSIEHPSANGPLEDESGEDVDDFSTGMIE